MEASVPPRAGSASENLVGTGQGQASGPFLVQVAVLFQYGGCSPNQCGLEQWGYRKGRCLAHVPTSGQGTASQSGDWRRENLISDGLFVPCVMG